MHLLAIDLEYRVVIGIAAMVLLFSSFLISFVISQRKKLQYHKDLHLMNEERQGFLTEQNELLEKGVQQRTAELFKQTEALQNTLTYLRTAQVQLIHAEKMASLGQLTAGIAHEIQNPLNFVNNFSEINEELIAEMSTKLKEEKYEEAILLANDIGANEQKIKLHGKRADAIVKGMLQHSRLGSGAKESIDLNKLVDEYMKLAYNGLRAKDKSLNVLLEANYDTTIGNIPIIAQDIVRVILNLMTNALYAVAEKNRLGAQGFMPTLWLTTKKIKNTVTIRVADNGNGVPVEILDKIFQPFFTTKPTGSGTGLGLSMSYDIITKGHGGELKLDTKEGEGAAFIIILPQ